MSPAEHLATLTPAQKRYLAGCTCMWCDMECNRNECGAMFSKCDDETIVNRRTAALKLRAIRVARPKGAFVPTDEPASQMKKESL